MSEACLLSKRRERGALNRVLQGSEHGRAVLQLRLQLIFPDLTYAAGQLPQRPSPNQQLCSKTQAKCHPLCAPTLQTNYQGPDAELAAMLENDVMDHSPGVRWTDIAGLADGKRVLEEAAVLPLMMPEYFTGIRKPVKVRACV